MAKPSILFDNRLADATPTASTTAAGYAVANLTDWRAYTWWQPTALPATVTVDCGSAQAADYALIYAHDLYTQGCTVEVRGSTDNFSASDVLVATSTPTSDDPLLVTFGSVSYRYWRLKITGAGAMPSLAIGVIGAKMELPTWLPQEFDPIGRQTQGRRNRNANGQPLGAVFDYEEWSQTVMLQKVTWSWLRATWLPAWRAHLRSAPFALAWDSASYPAEVRLVVTEGEFSTPHFSGAWADLEFDVTGVVA